MRIENAFFIGLPQSWTIGVFLPGKFTPEIPHPILDCNISVLTQEEKGLFAPPEDVDGFRGWPANLQRRAVSESPQVAASLGACSASGVGGLTLLDNLDGVGTARPDSRRLWRRHTVLQSTQAPTTTLRQDESHERSETGRSDPEG
jgi:hypothetical protein